MCGGEVLWFFGFVQVIWGKCAKYEGCLSDSGVVSRRIDAVGMIAMQVQPYEDILLEDPQCAIGSLHCNRRARVEWCAWRPSPFLVLLRFSTSRLILSRGIALWLVVISSRTSTSISRDVFSILRRVNPAGPKRSVMVPHSR